MNRNIRREKLARNITLVGSVFWIFFGVWGVNSSFEAAKEARNIQIRAIELNNGYFGKRTQAETINWVVPTTPEMRAYREVEQRGLLGTPYYFEDRLLRLLLTFVACLIVSFFVLYATVIVNPSRKDMWHEEITQSSTQAIGE